MAQPVDQTLGGRWTPRDRSVIINFASFGARTYGAVVEVILLAMPTSYLNRTIGICPVHAWIERHALKCVLRVNPMSSSSKGEARTIHGREWF